MSLLVVLLSGLAISYFEPFMYLAYSLFKIRRYIPLYNVFKRVVVHVLEVVFRFGRLALRGSAFPLDSWRRGKLFKLWDLLDILQIVDL